MGFRGGRGGRGRFGDERSRKAPALRMLPPDLRPLFDPRPPIPHAAKPSIAKPPRLTGLAGTEIFNLFEKTPPPVVEKWETPRERQKRKAEERAEKHKAELEELRKEWDPKNDPNIKGDAFNTLFVARISYDTTEKKLKREFEAFGSIKNIRLVHERNTGKEAEPRGYAFIEFEKESDMKTAYQRGDGKKIDGRRILCDVERGRTVKDWKPRRLGGGLGNTRAAKAKKGSTTASAPLPPPDARRFGAPPGGDSRNDRYDRGGGGGYDRSRDNRSYGGGSDRNSYGDRRGGYDRDRGGGGGYDRDRDRRGGGGGYNDRRGGGGYGDRGGGGYGDRGGGGGYGGGGGGGGGYYGPSGGGGDSRKRGRDDDRGYDRGSYGGGDDKRYRR